MNATTIGNAKVGDRVKFKDGGRAYTIQARNERFLVCTKPFNPKRTVLYTIIDLEKQIRGPENLVFGMGAETRQQCEEMIARLSAKDMASEVSYRRKVPLSIERVESRP